MASYGMNDVKNGMKIIVDGAPCVIIDTDYIKPGKGQAFTRVRYRNIKSGRVVELTMKSTDTVEGADVVDTDMQYPLQRRRVLALHAAGDLRAAHGRQGRRG
jgi:elongation factor P